MDPFSHKHSSLILFNTNFPFWQLSYISLNKGFSTAALVTFWAEWFFVVLGHPMHCSYLAAIVFSLDANGSPLVVTTKHVSRHKHLLECNIISSGESWSKSTYILTPLSVFWNIFTPISSMYDWNFQPRKSNTCLLQSSFHHISLILNRHFNVL